MGQKTVAFKSALPHTIPVCAGFTFLGIAYGMLMNSKGYGIGWTALMSTVVFTGAAQYVAITFLTSAFNPLYALLVTLMVNARHLFYGISLLEKFKDAGKLKPYLIFGMCDETFSLVHSAEPEEGVDRNWFMFFITLLNHSYWVLGSVLGGLIGSVVSFNTAGLDFSLTALFLVAFLGHWKTPKNRKPAMIGLVCSLIALKLFGQTNFIIPAMVGIMSVLTVQRKRDKAINPKHEGAN